MYDESTDSMPWLLRPMHEGDITQAVQIDRDAFPENKYAPPFRRDLRERKYAHYLVAVSHDAPFNDYARSHELPPDGNSARSGRARGGRITNAVKRLIGVGKDAVPPTEELIAGYLGLWAVIDEGHITSVGVRKSHRGQGIGELLVIGAVEASKLLNCRAVTLEVRVSNEVAQNLYKKYGFKIVGRRKRYYSDNGEDAYIMTTDPIDTPDYSFLFDDLSYQHSERWGVTHRTYGIEDEEE